MNPEFAKLVCVICRKHLGIHPTVKGDICTFCMLDKEVIK